MYSKAFAQFLTFDIPEDMGGISFLFIPAKSTSQMAHDIALFKT
jgi:hypothetical protein